MVATGPAESFEHAHLQLRAVVDELAGLSDETLDESTFFNRLLASAVDGLSAHGAVLWKHETEGAVRPFCQVNPPAFLAEATDGARGHAQVIGRVLKTGVCLLVPPRKPGTVCHNPTDQILLLAPIKVRQEVIYVLEVFQPPGSAHALDRVNLSIAERLSELGAAFLKNSQLQTLEARQAVWEQFDAFAAATQESLCSKETSFTVANDGRRLVGCQRLSIALERHGSYHVTAVSGQETLDTRSATVRALNALVTSVVRTREPFWYTGEVADLAPQIAEALEDYVELAHSKCVGIVPLCVRDSTEPADRLPLGAVIVEQVEESHALARLQQRTELVCRQATRALARAREHEELFLMPVWRALGRGRTLVQSQRLPKTIAVVAVILTVLSILVFVPYDFDVHATGTLQPVDRREIFAAYDGTVDRVLVAHGQQVERGQSLVELRNTDLDVSIADIAGQRASAQEELAAVERALVEGGKRLTPVERNRMSGEARELRQQVQSLTAQLELLRKKRDALRVVSPLKGEVITWNVDQLLAFRPVQQGQKLLDVADTTSEWELEVLMPEDRMGYIAEAQDTLGNALSVVYRLATDPATDRHGAVREIHRTAETRGEDGNTVLIRVAIDKSQIAHLQPGAECRAKVHCGRRALGYVLLHDVAGFIQSRILFRL